MDSPLAPQSQDRQIGPCVYRVEPLGFRSGRAALVRLGRLLGPAMAALDTSPGGNPQETIARALGELVGKLDDSDLEYFENLFRSKTLVILPDGREPHLSKQPEHFASANANMAHYFEWLYFSLEVSFGDFFRDAFGRMTRAKSLPTSSEKANTSG